MNLEAPWKQGKPLKPNDARILAVLVTICVSTLAGCKREQVQFETLDARTAAMAPAKPPAAAARKIIAGRPDRLLVNLAVDAYNSQVGHLSNGGLHNEERGGFLLFGPYVKMPAGAYRVSWNGEIERLPGGQGVALDVVSGRGSVVHGQLVVQEPGPVPDLEAILDEPVSDLEVRVKVPAGASVVLKSYEFKKKE